MAAQPLRGLDVAIIRAWTLPPVNVMVSGSRRGGMRSLNGVIDPQRLDDLAALLGRLGLRYMIEFYDDSNALISELRG
ncbi:hypothetical protein ACFY20_32445 [Streptomyces sp. NPDC001312]|uniref:hypothetical protein n=1 Tax=Streptomyces sp. NPDC001312 TaxID=3364561 RepID=UPI0036ADD373